MDDNYPEWVEALEITEDEEHGYYLFTESLESVYYQTFDSAVRDFARALVDGRAWQRSTWIGARDPFMQELRRLLRDQANT